jgi:hypothetical protein
MNPSKNSKQMKSKAYSKRTITVTASKYGDGLPSFFPSL